MIKKPNADFAVQFGFLTYSRPCFRNSYKPENGSELSRSHFFSFHPQLFCNLPRFFRSYFSTGVN
ncbi:hypothetical protein CH367_10370 [Leptospira barantonii]|uniref:Uncharacterized protein n=1 Tax=Leptospira barantonii TaxID=2023184 RepID=A0ABX4NK12_9LEPT|nr:hypothetical protein CH367_10370 [Leptospira barantonii]